MQVVYYLTWNAEFYWVTPDVDVQTNCEIFFVWFGYLDGSYQLWDDEDAKNLEVEHNLFVDKGCELVGTVYLDGG